MNPGAPVAIVDIGSNSVRLVVYGGATRAPFVLFNEKVMAGLGRKLDATGGLPQDAQARALAALGRFRLIVDEVGPARTRAFATAAVREATNGEEFLAKVRALGFDPDLLSGKEEGRLAALGVISGIPDADGVVGDLGGGSLELVDVKEGEVCRRVSLPLGVLRIPQIPASSQSALLRKLCREVEEAGVGELADGRPFYMVGGSWRALAQLDLELTDHPLPIVHQHVLDPERPRALQRQIAALLKSDRRGRIAGSRGPTLPHANLLLRAVIDILRPGKLVVSAYGIREGLLYDGLDKATRRIDPLIAAVREVGAGLGRFPQHGEVIDAWIAPVFDDSPAEARIRLAACHLADIAWAAHPDFRAERGVDMALHGNWVAIDAPGRVMMAQALFAAFGGGADLPQSKVARLCSEPALRQARRWGLAIRLAQRLSAGLASPLGRSSLALESDRIVLRLAPEEAGLFGESVDRRLKALAAALERKAEFAPG